MAAQKKDLGFLLGYYDFYFYIVHLNMYLFIYDVIDVVFCT